MQTSYTKDDTIFVQIASYRDPELQHTLQDLFKKAKRPENIFVGICHQYDMKEGADKHLFEIPFPRTNQLRIDEVDYREAKGCCWARNRVQKLWNGEKWTLMIDSHMRFDEGWDEICVSISKSLANEKYNPVLSTYVCTYDLQGNKNSFVSSTGIYFDGAGTAVNKGGTCVNISKPAPNALMSAHFCFGPSEIISDIEYDPLLYFIGEEISLSGRLWTSGYDLFIPHQVTVYHFYRDLTKPATRVVSTDNDILWHKRDAISRARVAHVFKTSLSKDSEVLNNLKKYDLGKKRSLKDFERFAGIDFKKKKQRERTKQCIFNAWNEMSGISSVKNLFKNSASLRV
jgi:hypothetical protein